MKNQFLELQILSQELWSDVKAINHNACNKKRTIANIEKTITKIKKLEFDTELKLLKEINGVK
jgi:hypothetical protein